MLKLGIAGWLQLLDRGGSELLNMDPDEKDTEEAETAKATLYICNKKISVEDYNLQWDKKKKV